MSDSDSDSESRVVVWFGDSVNSFFPSAELCKEHLPKYDVNFIPNKDSLIHCAWEVPSCGFMWYITHYHEEMDMFFGFVKLHDWEFAEWGDIPRSELVYSFDQFRGTMKALLPFRETFKRGPVAVKDIPFNGEKILKNT